MTDDKIKELWVEAWKEQNTRVEPDEEEIEALRTFLAKALNPRLNRPELRKKITEIDIIRTVEDEAEAIFHLDDEEIDQILALDEKEIAGAYKMGLEMGAGEKEKAVEQEKARIIGMLEFYDLADRVKAQDFVNRFVQALKEEI